MDEEDVIQWTAYSEELLANLGDIQNNVSYWESICNRLFFKKNSYDYKTLLAEAYARMLDDKDIDLAKNIIENTKERIEKHGREVLKQSYILSSITFTIIIITVLMLIVFNKHSLSEYIFYSESKFEIMITTLFGGIGAFVFTVLKLKTYTPEVILSKNVHILDGILRIFYGLISGLIIIICIKSNLLMGFVKDSEQSLYLYCFLGIIAGASDLLIPNLIKQFENVS